MARPERAVPDFAVQDRGKLLAALRSMKPPGATLRPHRPATTAPLSSAQRTLWFLDQLTSGTNAYNLVHYYRIAGDLDVPALERALRALVQRQQILRTCLREDGGEPIQIVVPEVLVKLPVIDHRGELGDCLERAREELAVDRIPLDQAPLWRAGLYRYRADCHLFVFAIHHAVYDGASERIFCAELAALYRAEVTGEPAALPALAAQYTDYAIWQRGRLDGGELEHLAAFWRDYLAGAGNLEMPADRPRAAEFRYRGDAAALPTPVSQPEAVRRLARERRTTTFVLYLAAFWILLHQYSGQQDIVIGISTSGRGRAQLEHLIGFFVNVIALRGRVTPQTSFGAAMRQADSALHDAMAHGELPFERVVQAMAAKRDLSRSPLFQVTFVTTPDIPAPALAGTQTEQLFLNHGIARFEMSWVVVEAGQPGVAVQFSTDTYDRATVDAMIGHYIRLVGWLLDHPDTPIAQAPAPGSGRPAG